MEQKTSYSDNLVDIRSVSVNKELPREERIAEFVRQIKNPCHFRCGKFIVRATYCTDGATLEESLKKKNIPAIWFKAIQKLLHINKDLQEKKTLFLSPVPTKP